MIISLSSLELVRDKRTLDDNLRWEAMTSKDVVEDAYNADADSISDELFKKVGLDVDSIQKVNFDFSKIWSRLKGHILRLCDNKRTIAENIFGLSIALYSDTNIGKEGTISLPSCAEGEELATTWWWSVSPYIMFQLMSDGYQPREILDAICKWGSETTDANSPLPSLENEFKYFGVQSLVLSSSANHVSHVYAQKLAEKVIADYDGFQGFRSS